ncbi:MAG TPA: hypothetical protein VJS43_13155, partial [Candidatus Acidoferrales bacterium]|nr:hypothetical protein [Candidatus Acidoferrales bacterium]
MMSNSCVAAWRAISTTAIRMAGFWRPLQPFIGRFERQSARKMPKVTGKLEGSGGVVEREAGGLVLVMIVGLPAKFFEAVAELLG